jgi:hypothetical protein
MKVLDLQCAQGHGFEGWFASELDFVAQCERALVQCPLCGDAQVHKLLSAPRLNLTSRRKDSANTEIALLSEPAPAPVQTLPAEASLTAAWLELSRRIVASTQDVGEQFAEEARRMHYGETEERAIRGKTTLDEARALVEEGIDIVPVLLPQSFKKPLQ